LYADAIYYPPSPVGSIKNSTVKEIKYACCKAFHREAFMCNLAVHGKKNRTGGKENPSSENQCGLLLGCAHSLCRGRGVRLWLTYIWDQCPVVWESVGVLTETFPMMIRLCQEEVVGSTLKFLQMAPLRCTSV
jgi:hypothetical protein